MYETYFVPNPDESSPVGLLEVSVLGVESMHHNPAYAAFIRRAIEASRVDDPQARVMEAFYLGGGIPRELMDQVEPTVQELDVAWPVRGRLYDLIGLDGDNAPFAVHEIEVLSPMLETQARDGISYLTSDGLLAGMRDGGFTAPLLYDVADPLELEREERVIAIELGAEICAYQAELVWRPGEDETNQPVLLSDRHHVALGHLAADGTFDHIVTLLAPSHPARRQE